MPALENAIVLAPLAVFTAAVWWFGNPKPRRWWR
jgi:hypothetical protein